MTLGLFTCADAAGHNQFNAWGSWKHIPDCSVSVFGDAPGVADHATRFGFRSIPSVKRNEFGRPLLNWIFERMHDESAACVLGYVNADIILLPGLAESIAAVRAQFDEFLIVARRWNVERLPAIDFAPGWDKRLRTLVSREGELFTPYGIDLFVFSRGLLRDVPPFALGSDYWDNYLVMRTRRRGYPVIDVTDQVMLVHQDHSLGKYRSVDERRQGPEGMRAFAMLGDSHSMVGRTTDATHVVADGELRPADTTRVAVVLSHAGDVRRLCHCLRALEYQTYPQSFLDVIVVNTDPLAPLRYLEADFPGVRVVTQLRPGASAARSKGISCANADVIMLLDSDVVPETNCIERAMRLMKDQPACQVVVCRIAPRFRAGKTSYIGRAIEWLDAATLYDHDGSRTEAGEFDTAAVIARKDALADGRVRATGVSVTFCRDAVVRRHTVRSIADLRRKLRRSAKEAFVDDWGEWRRHVSTAWSHKRIPSRYRAGVVLLAYWSAVWMVSARLLHGHQAPRASRRRRRRAGLPFTWPGARVSPRPMSNRDAGPVVGRDQPSA